MKITSIEAEFQSRSKWVKGKAIIRLRADLDNGEGAGEAYSRMHCIALGLLATEMDRLLSDELCRLHDQVPAGLERELEYWRQERDSRTNIGSLEPKECPDV